MGGRGKLLCSGSGRSLWGPEALTVLSVESGEEYPDYLLTAGGLPRRSKTAPATSEEWKRAQELWVTPSCSSRLPNWFFKSTLWNHSFDEL